jgi:hypothetical protein
VYVFHIKHNSVSKCSGFWSRPRYILPVEYFRQKAIYTLVVHKSKVLTMIFYLENITENSARNISNVRRKNGTSCFDTHFR